MLVHSQPPPLKQSIVASMMGLNDHAKRSFPNVREGPKSVGITSECVKRRAGRLHSESGNRRRRPGG
jgi:hypothetical protein